MKHLIASFGRHGPSARRGLGTIRSSPVVGRLVVVVPQQAGQSGSRMGRERGKGGEYISAQVFQNARIIIQVIVMVNMNIITKIMF